ncbi:MAG: hypothetical protein SFZ24_05320 [Planctomycetota bacterium]|nr:hypothetical protein [Planctomycetota bacterium]
MTLSIFARAAAAATLFASAFSANAAPAFVFHDPAQQSFGEPAGVTMREPATPREEEPVDLYIKTGPSFTYNNVVVYYTLDGSEPQGAMGVPSGTTQVLRNTLGSLAFVRNEPGMSGNDDWWRGSLPAQARQYDRRVRYKVSAFDSGGGPEVFAAAGAAFEYTTRLAWPGAGFGAPNPAIGYPPVHFWKEEGVVGNNYINAMIDQNGSLYDIYYPSVGAVQGMGTRNEGYDDGNRDEFPSCLTPEKRGQMNVNFGTLGLRVSGVTYWLSNQTGTAYSEVDQDYIHDTNVIVSTSRLVRPGVDLSVSQYDFAPKGVDPPLDDFGNPNRGVVLKRVLIRNNQFTPIEVNAYYFLDWALNGGDSFDGSFVDPSRGAMVAYDNTFRTATSGNGCAGEYNPTTFPSYAKDVSIYLAASMKILAEPSAAGGGFARDFWADTSADQGQGWLGTKLVIGPQEIKEINIALVGGFDSFAGATGTYDAQIDNALSWFNIQSLGSLQLQTENAWRTWLAQGVEFTSPEAQYNDNFRRSLLATALHLDGKNGGIIAGMHNGAYPYVWPRDAVWAAITLARTGFITESKEIFRFLRDIAFRDTEGWGRRGFWKQKYTTDGYTAWGNPQVDETSCYPWGVRFIYDVTGELPFLQEHYDEVYEAALASSQDSTVDNRLHYEEAVSLVYSMNLWEDQFDVTIYSNASVIRGLEDAAAIADILNSTVCPGGPNQCGYHTDRDLFNSRAAAIRGGLDARLDWNGENTDISQAGIVYPMNVYPAGHPRAELIFDRFNGVAPDRFGNVHPIVQFGAVPEWTGLINRYWGDGYWNGGPWFLSTLWYGAYYALRQDITPGAADIDNFKDRFDRTLAFRGGLGLGAEQMARNSTAVYPDFYLQTAYPNAWESMSFFVDSTMLFLDWTPDADANILRIRPKLPSDWSFMQFDNLRMGQHRASVRIDSAPNARYHIIENTTGQPLTLDTVVRLPLGSQRCEVYVNAAAAPHTYNPAIGAVSLTTPLVTGPAARTVITVLTRNAADLNASGSVDFGDITAVLSAWGQSQTLPFSGADATGDSAVNFADITLVLSRWGQSCP